MRLIVAIFLPSFVLSQQLGIPTQQQASITVKNDHRLKVLLTCEAKFMKVQLIFNTTRFTDWIVVGTNQNEKCRVVGNGDNNYVLQLPLTGDLCGTKMSDAGAFENVISIRTNPLLILQGDEYVNIRCVYGPPEVGTPQIPPRLPASPQPTFIENDDAATRPSGVAQRPTPDITESSVIPSGYVYLIVFLILFIALLALLCGCVYFFLKRRKIHLERRNRKAMLSMPSAAAAAKLTSGLWWPRTGKSSVANSNDALLSTDYMVSSSASVIATSNRTHVQHGEMLSVSTDYPGDTPPSTASSAGSPPDAQDGGKTTAVVNKTYHQNQTFVHDTRHMIPRAHIPLVEPTRHVTAINSLQSIPEEATNADGRRSALSEKKTGSGSVPRATEPLTVSTTIVSHLHRRAPDVVCSLSVDQLDTESISTLEGNQYCHPSPSEVVTQIRQIITTSDVRPSTLDEYAKAVEALAGSRKLSEQEAKRFVRVLTHDESFQWYLLRAKTLDDFEALATRPDYDKLFSKEKWALIVQALASVAFVSRLNKVIDNKPVEAEYSSPMKTKSRLFAKKGEQQPHPPPKGGADSQELRLFTRDSYYKVRDEMETMSSGDERSLVSGSPSKGAPGGTCRDRSNSECTEAPATLSVYLGNVQERIPSGEMYEVPNQQRDETAAAFFNAYSVHASRRTVADGSELF